MHWSRYALVGVATFAAYLWLCKPLIADYFPTTDEIAIEAASTPIGGPIHAAAWLTDGFQDYFRPYEEWGSRPSNFFRPLFNALFWIYYQLFGQHWAYQLVFGYLVHALAVAFAAYLAIAVCRVPRGAAVLATLIAALNPAVWALYPDTFAIPPVVQFPAYQTEILCGALVLMAFLAFVRRRFAIFAVAATLALFLKETALTIPIAALAIPGVWLERERSRAIRNFLWLGSPLAAWLLVKLLIFEHGFSSFVMTAAKSWSWLTQPIRNTLLWPTGLYTAPLGQTAAALRNHDWQTVAVHGLQLGINIGWWAAIGLALVLVIKRFGRAWLTAAPDPWVVALVFAGSNLALLIALQESHLRYGYVWFALGPAPVLGVLWRARAGIALSIVLGLGLALPQVASISNALSADSLSDYRLVKNAARQLAGLLGSLPAGVGTAYLVDDVAVQIPTPKYMAKFSGYRGRLLLVNSIRPLPHCADPHRDPPRYRLASQGDTTVLEYSAPACFEPYFGLPPLALMDPQHRVPRGPWMSYEYPQLSIEGRSALAEYDPGRNWKVSSRDPACANPGACAWIGFDEHADRYYRLDDATRPD